MKESVREYLESKYELERTLNGKSMYVLRDKATGALCFCKIIKRQCEVYKKLKAVKCKLLPEIYYLAYDENETLVIEEYIMGETFRQILNKEESISEGQCIDILLQLCDALRVLHKNGIIHRDIKPENVMMDIDGNCRLIDFDAARLSRRVGDMSKDTVLLGTKGYAPPEQYGYTQTDSRADIYALGVMINELLGLGNRKYKGKLRPILKKCLNFDPKNRYKSVLSLKLAVLVRKFLWVLIPVLLIMLSMYCVTEILNIDTVVDDLVTVNEMAGTRGVLLGSENIRKLYQDWDGEYTCKELHSSLNIELAENELSFKISNDYESVEGKAELLTSDKAVYCDGDFELNFILSGNRVYVSDNSYVINQYPRLNFSGIYGK
jgi:serine/threonine protein kinase